MFPVCRDAIARLRATPWTVVAGVGLVVADLLAAGVVVLASPVLPSFSPYFAIAGVALAQVVWVPLATPVLVAGYRLAAGDDSQASIGDAIHERAPATLAALVAERGVALVLAPLAVPFVVGFALALHTVGKAARYAVDPTTGLAPVELAAMLAVMVVLLGLTFAWLPAAFATPLIALHEDGWRRALARSGRAVRARPVAALRYWLTAAVLSIPVLLFVGSGMVVEPRSYVRLGLVYVALGVPARTLAVAYRTAFVEGVVAPVGIVSGDGPAGTVSSELWLSTGRIAVVALLLVALIAGVAVVRLSETGSRAPVEAGTVGDEPAADALFEAAHSHLQGSSFRAVERSTTRNATTGEPEGETVWEWAVDRRSKRIRTTVRHYYPNGTRSGRGFGSYLSEAVIANSVDPDATGAPVNGGGVEFDFGRTTERWDVLPGAGYALAHREVGSFQLPDRDGPWAVADRSNGNVTLVATGDAAGRVATEGVGADDLTADSYVRATFDRDSGRLLRVEERLRVAETANEDRRRIDHHRVTVFTDYGETDVRRPDGLGPRSPLEWVWDLAYY